MSSLDDIEFTFRVEDFWHAGGETSGWGNPRLTEDQVYGRQRCVRCGKQATTWCSSCEIREVGDVRVLYCGEDCQKKHEKDHQEPCLAVRRLGRAMQILNELWTDFEAATSTGDFRLIYAEGRDIFTEDISPWGAMTGRSVFVPFYTNRQVIVSSPAVTRAMLFHGKSSEPFTTGLPLIKLILGGKWGQTHKDILGTC